MLEPPAAVLLSDQPRPPRNLMDLPHELIIKVIIEVILEDRTTGRDQVRANSGTYALSRTNAYWQAEVESQYRKLYVETSLFPGFAIWSLQSDWLFRRGKRFSSSSAPRLFMNGVPLGRHFFEFNANQTDIDAFSPSNRASSASASASVVDGVTTPRPRTQASSVSPTSSRTPALCSFSEASDYYDTDSDGDGWGSPDNDSEISFTYAPRPPRSQAVDLDPSRGPDAPKAAGGPTFDDSLQISNMTAAER